MHPWTECPAIELTYRLYPVPKYREAIRKAAILVGAYVDDDDKAGFHRFACLGSRDPKARRAVDFVAKQVLFEAGYATFEDLAAEFHLPLRVHNHPTLVRELSALGLPLQFSALMPGDEPYLIAIRASVGLADDAPKTVRDRVVIVACRDCGERCFRDPLSAPTPDTPSVCLPCVRRMLVADRRAGRNTIT